MGFVGNAKLATDAFQKVKNKIYFLTNTNKKLNQIILSIISSNKLINNLIFQKLSIQNKCLPKKIEILKLILIYFFKV